MPEVLTLYLCALFDNSLEFKNLFRDTLYYRLPIKRCILLPCFVKYSYNSTAGAKGYILLKKDAL